MLHFCYGDEFCFVGTVGRFLSFRGHLCLCWARNTATLSAWWFHLSLDGQYHVGCRRCFPLMSVVRMDEDIALTCHTTDGCLLKYCRVSVDPSFSPTLDLRFVLVPMQAGRTNLSLRRWRIVTSNQRRGFGLLVCRGCHLRMRQ